LTGGDGKPGALVVSSIPLDIERRCEQRWAARFEAARALREQHRLEDARLQFDLKMIDQINLMANIEFLLSREIKARNAPKQR
jgi:hypothetical protein